jgi:hypothetical protein
MIFRAIGSGPYWLGYPFIEKGVKVALNWNNGQLITLKEGVTATAEGLSKTQLYGLFFYNHAQNDADTDVTVTWKNGAPPEHVVVPGTTRDEGLASVLFVYGGDTTTVSAAVTHGNPGAAIEAFICSVKLPIGGSGINNQQLPANGSTQSFTRYTRYYAVVPSHWFGVGIESDVNQFIVVRFAEAKAQVLVVNATSDPDLHVNGVGQATSMYTTESSTTQRLDTEFQGNGTQTVWMNADSVQNSQNATIALQSLSGLRKGDHQQERIATTGV